MRDALSVLDVMADSEVNMSRALFRSIKGRSRIFRVVDRFYKARMVYLNLREIIKAADMPFGVCIGQFFGGRNCNWRDIDSDIVPCPSVFAQAN
jgi:hypothetical protein